MVIIDQNVRKFPPILDFGYNDFVHRDIRKHATCVLQLYCSSSYSYVLLAGAYCIGLHVKQLRPLSKVMKVVAQFHNRMYNLNSQRSVLEKLLRLSNSINNEINGNHST